MRNFVRVRLYILRKIILTRQVGDRRSKFSTRVLKIEKLLDYRKER